MISHRPPRHVSVLVLLGAIATASAPGVAEMFAGGDDAVAVIVNAANTSPDPTFEELRAILTLERQFWKDGRRIVLILPPSDSSEKSVLLQKVYRQTDVELRRTWAQRLFAGEIPAIPSSVRSSEALVGAVMRSPGAIAVVPASSLRPGVRVLAIEGKRPGSPGYPLSTDG